MVVCAWGFCVCVFVVGSPRSACYLLARRADDLAGGAVTGLLVASLLANAFLFLALGFSVRRSRALRQNWQRAVSGWDHASAGWQEAATACGEANARAARNAAGWQAAAALAVENAAGWHRAEQQRTPEPEPFLQSHPRGDA